MFSDGTQSMIKFDREYAGEGPLIASLYSDGQLAITTREDYFVGDTEEVESTACLTTLSKKQAFKLRDWLNEELALIERA